MDQSLITFRPLQETDLELMYQWLNEAHVHRWWGQDGTSREEIIKQYMPVINGVEPTMGFICSYDGEVIGYVQAYKVNDYPEYVGQLDLKENAAGMDLFIGNKEYVGKGLGTQIIKKFTRDIVFTLYPNVTSCIADPAVENIASVKAFQNAGFTYLKDSYDRQTGEKEVLLILTR